MRKKTNQNVLKLLTLINQFENLLKLKKQINKETN